MASETSAGAAIEEFTSLDECISHFTDMGFKCVKDAENDGSRTLTLRRYVMDQHGEVIVKQSGSKINIMQTVNGKPVANIG